VVTLLRRFPGAVPGGLCLASIAVMGWASFLPYMSIPAWWNDGLQVGPGPYSVYFAGWSLADGGEIRLVVVLLAVLAVGSIASLAGIRRRSSAVVSLIVSVGLAVYAQFMSSDGGRYVLPAWVLPGSGGEVAPVEPVTVGVGYIVFLASAVLAVIASLSMVVMSRWGGLPTLRGATTQPS
jgi:hypothetical protein